ncbi:MAG: dipeptidase [Verrucomicrobia bacterium]|jgi:acetylornithine deacetylase/succinyl-diaminopimelate desuccinylase-like protein|nr:dipeptidase [Verrucomicrobiota bacterium]
MKAVLDYLKRNRRQAIKDLCDYVRFPSVSAQPQHRKDLTACAQWLARYCRNLGLDARLCPTKGHPIVVATTRTNGRSSRPHFLVYGHYDVQPPEPLDLWHSPPFEPRIAGGRLFARGASDNKGQHLAHLKAVEAYLKTRTELPCDLTFVIEGEEEVGSASLAPFLRQHRRELGCQAVVVSDTGMPDKSHPALTYALRGLAALEITVHGPSRDLHSGVFGGSVENPAMALARMLAQTRDDQGRITIPGFYQDVQPLRAAERRQFQRLPFQAAAYRKLLGVPALFGEAGFSPLEQRSARPTLEINGLTSGYQGEGSKTIVPAWARAKLTFRLVPHQDPNKVMRQICRHLRKICPPSVRLELEVGHHAKPYLVPPSGPYARAALCSLQQAFQREPVLLREGGSIPIVNEFRAILGVDTLLLGLGLPDDNMHSPNEKFDLECFDRGQLMSAHLWPELARAA